VKSRSAPVSQFMAPLRTAAQRFAYSAFLLMSVSIIVLGKADSALVERVRTATADFVSPVLSVLSQPVAAVTGAVDRVRQAVLLYQENDRLRAENATLLQWQQAARQLEGENTELRALTNYYPEATSWFVSGQVIGTAGGAYSRNLLINRGSADGVAKGQAVASGTGLVGRIAEVGGRASRVLLLTDINSRIPVSLDSTHERAILAGDNTDRPLLIYLPPHAKPVVGEKLVTSGDGGVFPPGLVVGVVASIDGAAVRVEPSTDLSRVEYLRVVDFGLGGVLPQNAVPLPKQPKKGQADQAQLGASGGP
jgi:rod shape-determining protein MreC